MRKEILEYIQDNSYDPSTKQIHVRHLSGLVDFASNARGDPAAVSLILGYLQTLRPHARKRAWSVFKQFFMWRVLTARALISPMVHIPRPKALTKPHHGLSADDLGHVLDQLDKDLQTKDPIHLFAAVRMKAMVMLTLYYGTRPGDLHSLTLKDYDSRSTTLYLKKKGTRQVTWSVDPEIASLLSAWIQYRAQFTPSKEQAFFVTHRGLPLKRRTLINQFDKLLARAGVVSDHSGFHQFRHTMAGIMVERGDSLQEIARYLGHYSLSSTDYYLRRHFGQKPQAGKDIVQGLLNSRSAREQSPCLVPLKPLSQDDQS